jgi:hypothetical protein
MRISSVSIVVKDIAKRAESKSISTQVFIELI